MSYIDNDRIADVNLNMVDYMKSRCEGKIPNIIDFIPQMREYQEEIRQRFKNSESEYLRDAEVLFSLPHLDMQLKELAELQLKDSMDKIPKDDMEAVFRLTDYIFAAMCCVVYELITDEDLVIGVGMDQSKGVGYRCIMNMLETIDTDDLDDFGAEVVFYGPREECTIPEPFRIKLIEDTESMIPDNEPILTDGRQSDFRKLRMINRFGGMVPNIKQCTLSTHQVNMLQFPIKQYHGQDTDWGLESALREIKQIETEIDALGYDIEITINFYDTVYFVDKVLAYDDDEDGEVEELFSKVEHWICEYLSKWHDILYSEGE